MNLAIIDLDGVIASNTERFARATFYGSIDWSVAFNPALVDLDTLIAGADLAVARLEKQLSYTVIFLTSRPETMREATEAWLAQHDLDGYELVMKQMDKQFTKTVHWKADEVRRMARLSGVESVLFIDDEANNRYAVEALGMGIAIKASLDDYAPDETAIIV